MSKINYLIVAFVVIGLAALVVIFAVRPISVDTPAAAIAAAIQLNQETLWSIAFSLIGTAALVMTLRYTALAATAAVKASDAALLAVKHAQESSVRDLRPYLAPEEQSSQGRYDTSDLAQVIKRRFVRIIWKNEGKTPATNVVCNTEFALYNGDRLPIDYTYPDDGYHPAAGIVGPGAIVHANSALIRYDILQSLIDDPGLRLHVFAWIEYDGFDASRRYRTKCHYYCQANGYDLKAQNFRLDFFIAEGHWGMDEFDVAAQ